MAGRFLSVSCMQCQSNDIACHKIPSIDSYKIFNHNNQKEHIEFTCNKGHKNIILIDELPFETLIHMAFDDFINQYYRESVFNFASAQERFFEFVIRFLCHEQSIKNNNFITLWKIIQNQSERQFGSFCALYFQRFQCLPFTQRNFEENAKIRNNVVHKGNSPTEEEAKTYGSFVIENLHTIMKNILENIDSNIIFDIKQNIIRETFENRGPIPNGAHITTVSSSIISWSLLSDAEIDNGKKLGEYSRRHSKEYAQMASEANRQHKILHIDDHGKLDLVEQDFYKKEKKFYRGEKNFEDYINSAKTYNIIYQRSQHLI